MITNNLIKFSTLISALLVMSQSYAAADMQVDRYSTVSEAATPAQINPLLTVVQVTFPERITTIGDAMNYVLRYSGYALVPLSEQSSALITVLAKPLPLVDRQMGPMTIHDALLVLVGQHTFTLTADPINRVVNVELIHPVKKITTAYGK
ncbi:MAG: hypothetical protein ACK4PR_01160 [Gammaproteobacteria bacterium]